MATAIAKPELSPVANPGENLRNYCRTVGLDERDFIELPTRRGIFLAGVDLEPSVCAAMGDISVEYGGHNRKLRLQAVKQYAHSVGVGGFSFTGQTIIVSDKWTVLDGHHRTRAGKIAERPLPALLVFGIPDDLFDIIDNSVGRSLADNMELSGIGRSAWVGHAVNMLITAERSNGDPLARTEVTITPRDRHEYVEAHLDDLKLAKEAALAIEDVIPVSLPETVYALYLWRKVDAEKTRQFVDAVISGADLAATDARLAFTKWVHEAEKRRGNRNAPKRKENLVAVMKALRCFFHDTPLPKLSVGKKEAIPGVE